MIGAEPVSTTMTSPLTRVVDHRHEPFDVYIGRPSEWGNMWSHKPGTTAEYVTATREEAVARYEAWLLSQPALMARVRAELRGQVLGCWCGPGQRCHGQVLARVADSEGPLSPAFADLTIDVSPFVAMEPINARAMFGKRVVCLDVETDARYTELGVGRLVCMTYSFDGLNAYMVGADEAVELFRDWILDENLLLFGQSVYSDLGVLAQAMFRKTAGRDCVPGEDWAYELVHRAYAAKRVVDTEIRQRLTNIRFGPHKSNPGLAQSVKQYFGVDLKDGKSVSKTDKDATKALLAASVAWDQWPTELFERIPWRFKFGALADVPLAEWPAEAIEYAKDDVLWPWHLHRRQALLWSTLERRKVIPDEDRQTLAAWHLHLLAIPGWVADRERAQAIRVFYTKVVAHCERTLVRDGIVEITPPALKIVDEAAQALVHDALGEKAKLPATYAASNPNPTPEQRRAHCSLDAAQVKKALAVHGLKVLSPEDVDLTLQHPLQAFGLWKKLTATRGKPVDIDSTRLDFLVEACERELLSTGLLSWTPEVRTKKSARVTSRVFRALGENAPLTKKKALLYKYPTLKQREEFCSSDKKAVREAILANDDAKALNVVDAVERAEVSSAEFDAWLVQSNEPELNAYALYTTAQKIIVNFLDKLDIAQRVRTTYQTVLETGRTASRALNIQQFPRDFDKPGHLHIRGCILPDPDWVFLVADYSQLELCALAHVLTQIVRWYATNPDRKREAERVLEFKISADYESSLARAINDGKDCHLIMAGTLLGKSYEYCETVYAQAEAKKKAKQPLSHDENEVVEARQLSKACNFGFPGGLGEKKFIDYAMGYGVSISLARAQTAKLAFKRAWPEMKLYFHYIGEKCSDAGPKGCVIKQLKSNRLRGGCTFTQASNGYFQSLAADGAKEALAFLIEASYRNPLSPLYGCRPSGFVHDEFLVSAPRSIFERTIVRSEKEGPVPLALVEVERLMIEAMRLWIPNIKIQAPGKVMSERWSK